MEAVEAPPKPEALPTQDEVSAWEREALKEQTERVAEQKEEETPLEAAQQANLAEAIVSLVVYVHRLLSEATHWQGWALNEEEKGMWTTLSNALGSKLRIKDLPLILAAVGVLISEAIKIAGYIRYRRGNPPAPKKGEGANPRAAAPAPSTTIQSGVIPLETLGPVPGRT